MPTPAQVQADPKFLKLSPKAQKIVLAKLGGNGGGGAPPPDTPTGGNDDFLTSLFNAGGDAVQGVATGAGKEALRGAAGAGMMVNKALAPVTPGGVGVADAIQPGGLEDFRASMEPQGVAEKLGGLGMHGAEVGLGAMATGGSSLLASILAGGAGAGAMEGAASGGDVKSMLMAAATGGAGRALTGAKALKAGVGALGEGGKDAAKARLPELMDEIALAQQKGAVPGHGMIPKVLAQERDSLLRMLTEEAAPAAKSAVEGAPSNLEKVIGEAAKFFFPKTARVAGKLLGRD